MTLEQMVGAAAQRLRELWPEREVYVDRMPEDAGGNFFLGVIESDQSKGLGRCVRRSVRLRVCYFLQSADNMDYLAWAETMYDAFRVLEVSDGDAVHQIRLINRKAGMDSDGRCYQFLFEVKSILWERGEAGDLMEEIQQKGEIIP